MNQELQIWAHYCIGDQRVEKYSLVLSRETERVEREGWKGRVS